MSNTLGHMHCDVMKLVECSLDVIESLLHNIIFTVEKNNTENAFV